LAVSELISCGSLPAAGVSIGVERKNHLKRRMNMILKGLVWPRLSRPRRAAVIGFGALAIGVSLTRAAARVEAAGSPIDPSAFSDSTLPNAVTSESKGDPSRPGTPSLPLSLRPAPPSTLPDLSQDMLIKIRPGDDETQRMLKERYNAAIRGLRLSEYQYDIGKMRVGSVLSAARSVLEASLALAKTQQDEIRARQDHLDFVMAYWKRAKAKLDIGGATGFSPVDEAQAREALYDAKLRLIQLLPKEHERWADAQNTQKPVASRATETLPTPSPAAQQHTAARDGSETLPALLTAKPLQAAHGDDEMRKLFKERYNAALATLQGQYQRSKIDTAMPMPTLSLVLAGRALQEAELALAGPTDVLSVYERHLQLTRFLDQHAESLLKKGLISTADFQAAREAHLGAEVKVRAQRDASAAKAPPPTAGLPETTKPLPAGPATAAVLEPALLETKPLEEAPSDHPLQKLLKERYNAAVEYLRRSYRRFQIPSELVSNNAHERLAFHGSAAANVYDAARRLVDAELALSANPSGETGVRERYLEFTQFFEARVKQLTVSHGIPQEFLDAAREARLDAEIKLLQAKSVSSPMPSPTTRRTESGVQELEALVRIAEAEVTGARAFVEQGAAKLKLASANLKYRANQLGRVQALRKGNGVSQQDVDAAVHARDEAEAGVETAKARVGAAQAQVEIKLTQLEQVQVKLKQAKESEGKR
jgi:hypothetical protein